MPDVSAPPAQASNAAQDQAVPAAAPATPAPAATPEASAPATPEITPEIARSQPPDVRDRVLFGENFTPSNPLPPAAPTEPKSAETAPPAAASPVPEPEKTLPNRISTAQFDPREQEAIRLRHDLAETGENISLLEAIQRTNAKYEAPKPPAPAEAAPVIPGITQAPPAQAAADPLAALRAEVAAMEAQLTGHNDELVSPEYNQLVIDYNRKTAQLTRAEIKAEAQQESRQTQRLSAREQAKEDALAAYPTANDDATLLGAEITKQFLELQSDPNHPERHRFFNNDDGPKWLTERAAEAVKARLVSQLGCTDAEAVNIIKGKPLSEAKGPAVAAPVQQPSTAVPRNLAVTAPGTQTTALAPTLTPAQARELANANPKARDAALFGEGGTFIGR